MKEKKIISTLVSTAIILILVSAVFIDYNISQKNFTSTDIKRNSISDEIDLEKNNSFVSDVLTFDEITRMISNDNIISQEKAEEIVINNCSNNQNLKTNKEEIARALTYRTFESTLVVDSSYKPTLRFYCETSESSTMFRIVKVLNIGMNRDYNGTTKAFGGSVYANLENGHKIFWIINGDFYNNGTTTVEGRVNKDISAEGYFTASYAINFYKYCYKEGYWSRN